MHWMDIIAIVIAAWFIVKDYFNGLILSSFRLIGLIVGVIVGSNYSVSVGNALFGSFGWNPTLTMALGYVILFIGVILIAQVLAGILKAAMNLVLLGWVDKLGGIVLGAVKAAIVLSVIFWILTLFPGENRIIPQIRQQSKAYMLLQNIIPSVQKTLIDPFFDQGKLKDLMAAKGLNEILPSIKGTPDEFNNFIKKMGSFDFQEQQYLLENFKKLDPEQRKKIMEQLSQGGKEMKDAFERLNLGLEL